MVKKYKTQGIANRWGKYYMAKFAHVVSFLVKPHPTEFAFAIYVTFKVKGHPSATTTVPIGN